MDYENLEKKIDDDTNNDACSPHNPVEDMD